MAAVGVEPPLRLRALAVHVVEDGVEVVFLVLVQESVLGALDAEAVATAALAEAPAAGATARPAGAQRRWDCASRRALLIRMRASAVKPANATQTWSSIIWILRIVRGSCNLAMDFFSTPSTTQSAPRTPTASVPLRTASMAYST